MNIKISVTIDIVFKKKDFGLNLTKILQKYRSSSFKIKVSV